MAKFFSSKKLLLFFVALLLCCFVAIPSLAHAWDARQKAPLGEALDVPEENNLEKMVAYESLQLLPGVFNCALIGLDCTADEEAQSKYQQNSLVGITGNLIAAVYAHPPASFSYYAYDLLHNAGLVPKAYAQGIGFSGLTPILPLWKAFRNIAYMLIVVFLIVIGLMIMFRMKIDPQTVISIQNALPRIAITLLFITFSYAIAGFLIDLMYLSIMLVVAIFGQSGLITDVAIVQEHYLTGGLANLIGAVFSPGAHVVSSLVTKLILGGGGAGLLGAVAGGQGLPGLIFGGLFQFIGGPALIAGALVALLIGLALFFMLIRIFTMLASAYIQIIVAIIFAPLQIVIGAFPGAGGFRSWFLSLLSNIIVFPATAALLILGMVLATMPLAEGLWVPPMIYSGTGGAIRGLLALGIISLTPSMVGSIKKAFGAAPMMPMGVSAVAAPVAAPITAGVQLITTARMAGFESPNKSLASLRKAGGSFVDRFKGAATGGGGGGGGGGSEGG